MKVLWILLSFLISTMSWGQTAGQDFQTISEGLKFITEPKTKLCEEPKDYLQVVCTPQKEEKSPNALIYKITNSNQIPADLKEKFKNEKIDKSSPLYLSLSLVNDNFNFKDANDLNYTHGVLLQSWKTNSKGITFGANYNSDLYTQRFLLIQRPDGTVESRPFSTWDNAKNELKKGEKYVSSGDKSQNIHFVEDSWISLVAHNKEQGEWYTWDAELGFEKIEYQQMSKLGGANLQRILHNKLNLVKYNYHSTPKDDEFNAFLKTSLGVKKKMIESQVCDVIVRADVELGLDLAKIRRHIGSTLGAEVNVIKYNNAKNNLLTFTSDISYRSHNKGQTILKPGVEIDIKNWKIGYQYIIPLFSSQVSNGLNLPNLPLDNESMGRITIKAPLGFKK